MDWQVEMGLRISVFLSSTSLDLKECRRRAADILQHAGVLPVGQDYFGPDARTVDDLLIDKIQASDAVVCLIGHVFGSAPSDESRQCRRSYTQIEYDLALRYEKPLYLFIASDEFAKGHPVDEPADLRAYQTEFRRAILTGPKKYDLFSSVEELERHVHLLVQPVLARAGRRAIRYVHMPPAPLCFVGRTDEIAQCSTALDSPLPGVIVMLGMGGQGKTTLLAQVLRSRKGLPFAAGVWVSAERGGFTFSEFLDCALEHFMGNRFNKADYPQIDTRICKLISLLQARPLLVVIDGAERWLKGWLDSGTITALHDLSLRQGAYEGFDEFLEQASALETGSHVVLTSRALPAALDTVKCRILPVFPKNTPASGLDALPPDAAVELLERLGLVAPREKIREVARTLAFHPLALTGFARVAKRLGANWESLLSGRGSDPSRVLHSLLDEIRKHLPDRQRSEALLKFSALLPEGATLDILDWLLSTDASIIHPDETDVLPQVLALSDWNLLVWDATAGSVRLHALIAEYFAELISKDDKRSIHSRAAAWYETHAIGATAPAEAGASKVRALRHRIVVRDAAGAFRIMFANGRTCPALRTWLVENGHLWECTELLVAVQEIVTGLDKVQCILARAQILNDLELSHRALADIQQATGLVRAHRGPTLLPLQSLLARCHGMHGVIELETARATNALPLLDKAVALFETATEPAGESLFELAGTLANRGLARWSCGDWDGAEADYARLLDLLRRPELQPQVESSQMAIEIRARLGALQLDRGDPAGAVQRLEASVAELRKVGFLSRNRSYKNQLAILVSLAAARNAAGYPETALDLLQEVIVPLQDMARQGRWEYNSILAQAHVNEALALLRLGKPEAAATVSGRAIRIYEDLIEKGASQFRGQLGNALFRQAEAHVRSSKIAAGCEALQRALHLIQDWLRLWAGECNVENVSIENALQMLSCLPTECTNEKREILKILQQCLDRVLTAPHRYGAIRRSKDLMRDNWDVLKTTAGEAQFPWRDEFPEA